MFGIEPADEGFRFARDGRVADRPADGNPESWVAVGLEHDAGALGALLRSLREQGHAVQGFVDRTVALVAGEKPEGMHIGLALARTQWLLAVVFGDGTAVELQRAVRLPGGESRLIDSWLALAARTLVQQTRFDPLHHRHSEQQLRAALPGLAAEAARNGQALHVLHSAGRDFPLVLTRDQLAAETRTHLAPVAAALQALVASLPDCSLLVDERFGRLPGADALLDSTLLAEVRHVPDGAAARAASLLPGVEPLASGGVQYLTRIRAGAARMPDALPLRVSAGEQRPMATHLVYRGRAIAIGEQGLVIGRDPGAAAAVLALPEGVAGLSRRHCTLRRERGRTQVIDHSQHGSFVDGARVRGRAFLAAGSTLRLGTPGIELPLVSLEA